MARIGRISVNARGPELVAHRTSLHQNVATWATLLGAAIALCTVVFTAGDANQRLLTQGEAQKAAGARVDTLERDVTAMKVSLGKIEQASNDTRDTVHRLERAHVHTKGGD